MHGTAATWLGFARRSDRTCPLDHSRWHCAGLEPTSAKTFLSGPSLKQPFICAPAGGCIVPCASKRVRRAWPKRCVDSWAKSTSTARASGYQLLTSTKPVAFDDTAARAWLDTRYRIEDAHFGDVGLATVPGIFSRQQLDRGTSCLIDHLAANAPSHPPRRVLDLCAGAGPLAIWVASFWPTTHVVAVESNGLATGMLSENARTHGVAERIDVRLADALEAPPPDAASRIDLALCNPPTHADPEVLERLLAGVRLWLAPGGEVHVVVNRSGRAMAALHNAGAHPRCTVYDGYTVVVGRW